MNSEEFSVKAYIKKLPIVGPLSKAAYHYIYQPIRDRCTLLKLAHVDSEQGRTIAQVLRQLKGSIPQTEQHLIAGLEDERKRLLLCEEPLVNGSLDKPGLYDEGSTVQDACRVSKPPKQSLLMYLLIRAFKPLKVIELGTNVGISSAFQATALKLNGQGGRLITLEASPYRLRLAKELHRNLDLDNVSYIQGLFSDTLNTTLSDFGPVDFAFIDGHHQYQPTLDYYQAIWEHSTRPDTLFVFDDIRWSDGMKQAWSDVQADNKTGLSVDLGSMGLCVGAQEPSSQHHQFGPLYSTLS